MGSNPTLGIFLFNIFLFPPFLTCSVSVGLVKFIHSMDDKMKSKERKAFWIGLGSVLAVIFLLIGFLSLAFSTDGSKSADDQPQVQKESSQKEKPETEADQPQEASQQEETASQQSESSDEAGITHEVESGDTLYSIGLEYDVDWKRIAEVNDLEQDTVLKPGQELLIPSE